MITSCVIEINLILLKLAVSIKNNISTERINGQPPSLVAGVLRVPATFNNRAED